jgi:hypothetical protein
VSDELREAVAREHGLPEGSASFLTGSSLVELEQSAERFAELLTTSRPQEPEPVPELDPIRAALRDKQAQKRELREMFVGRERRSQPRDTQGRYASFDGGYRGRSVPLPKDPIAEHDRLVASVASVARTFGL